jgi:hypothetical protein
MLTKDQMTLTAHLCTPAQDARRNPLDLPIIPGNATGADLYVTSK